MSALYTVDQTLQPNDYYAKVIKAMSYKRPLQAIIKRGPTPEQWAQQIEVEGGTESFEIAAPEGGDFDEEGLVARTNLMLEVQLQKFRSKRGYFVTRETRMLPGYTEKKGEKALARSQRRDAEEVTLSIERALGSNQEAVVRGKSQTAIPKTRGLLSWLDTAVHAVQAIPTELMPTAGLSGNSMAAFTEEAFKAELVKAALETGDGDIVLTGLVGLKMKQHMSNWLGKAETVAGVDTILRRTEPKSRKIEFICDEFSYDGATVRTVVDNHLNCEAEMSEGQATGKIIPSAATFYTGAFIRPEFWTIDTLEALTNYDLEDRGGGPRGYHEAILRLACRNPLGQFKVVYQAA